MRKLSIVTYQLSIQKGFTLVELVLFMGLMLLLIGITTSVFTTAVNIQLESVSASSVQQDERYLVAKLKYDIERASAIILPATKGVAETTIQLSIGGLTNTYSVSDGNLQVTASGITNNLNGYDITVSDFSVTRIGNTGGVEDTLTVSFTLTSKTKKDSGYESEDVQTTFALRHH